MENKFLFTQNGQELQQADFDLVADNAARADDRTLAEILRMSPYNGSVAKGIMPYTYQGIPAPSTGIVQSAGATGRVQIFPFRMVVGSRDTIAHIGVKENFRDIRTGVFNTDNGSGATQTILLSANASGNPRWDLVYAVLSVDQNGPNLTRYIKNPSTKNIAASPVLGLINSNVTVATVTGTAAASPDPANTLLPGDSVATFCVPLAYVRVPNGFNGTSTVGAKDILHVTPIAGIGGLRVANHQYKVHGTAMTAARAGAWASSGTRPEFYMPADMSGSDSRIVYMGIASGSSGNWSHTDATVIDDTIDWRRRVFKVTALMNNQNIPSVWSTGATTASVPRAGQYTTTVIGQSIFDDVGTFYTTTNHGGVLCYFDSTNSNSLIASPNGIGMYVDSTTGAIMALIKGSPGVNAMFWIEATNAYCNL